MNRAQHGRMELWAGPECTLNRVGDRYYDQFALGGHYERPGDLDLLAELGARSVRYPVLWERHCGADADWSWAEARLGRLRELGIRPIVGLVHHGSGPAHTSLCDPGFAPGLAEHARRVAERFPWVDAYTPVNEPLTTARFSGLYGFWYPHGADAPTFARCLLGECRATVLAMRAIRSVHPGALLVQTEDFGQIYADAKMRYQADFENERRWLTWDLLCGRVDRRHPLWNYLIAADVEPKELHWFLDHPCPPDIVGVNHYVTSNRYLDSHIAQYPAHLIGCNDRHVYVDTEAVRRLGNQPAGWEALLMQVWQRYRLPIAVTEAHLACHADEQLRWLWAAWRGAECARMRGADVRAVTAWSIFGAHDWDSLVTRSAGNYEPGAYDVRDGAVRRTPLANLIADLGQGREPDYPALAEPGWWQRPERLLYRPRRARLGIHR